MIQINFARKWEGENVDKGHLLAFAWAVPTEISLRIVMAGYNKHSRCSNLWRKYLVLGFWCVDPDSNEACLLHIFPMYHLIRTLPTYILDYQKYLSWPKNRFQENGTLVISRHSDQLYKNGRQAPCWRALLTLQFWAMCVHPGWSTLLETTWTKNVVHIHPQINKKLLAGTAKDKNSDETPDQEMLYMQIRQCFEAQISSLGGQHDSLDNLLHIPVHVRWHVNMNQIFDVMMNLFSSQESPSWTITTTSGISPSNKAWQKGN